MSNRILLVALATFLLQPFAHAEPATWLGTYSFYEFVEPNQNMIYDLRVYKTKSGLEAKLKVDGFQTLIRARGKADLDGSKCRITFSSAYEDDELEVPPTNPFKQGETMLTLERQKGKLITKWGALEPLKLANQKPGVYFEKTKKKKLQ